MSDTIVKLGNSYIQHGPNSNRIYLMKLDPSDLPHLIGQLDQLAARNPYTKIFAKVPSPHAALFLQHGYTQEGLIPQFYHASTDAAFLGKFLDPERAHTIQMKELVSTIELARNRANHPVPPLPDGYLLRVATPADIPALASLYDTVFDSYPFPIQDPAYLAETMQTHVLYVLAEKKGRLAAAASAEMDRDNANAEMTDFATHPDHTGQSLAAHLLRFMEPEARTHGITTCYTIARAISPPMNITFARCGYAFGGTLVNNTQISGSIESMNLWYKPLT